MKSTITMAVLALVLSACQAAQAPSPSATVPSPSPATPAPTSPEPSADTARFVRYSMVEVVTDGLRMRSQPGLRDSSIELKPPLDHGTRAFVLDEPVEASGFEWIRIHPRDPSGRLPEAGWVAVAAKGGEPWVQPHPVNCPPPIHFFGDHSENPLGCYGPRSHTFEARLGVDETGPCFELDVPWRTVPEWLDDCALTHFLVDPAAPVDSESIWQQPRYPVAISPESGWIDAGNEPYLPANWPLVSVTGQFDHPSAATCRAVADPSVETVTPKPDSAVVEFDCRASFVVTALRVLVP